jgi:hypothetical protein
MRRRYICGAFVGVLAIAGALTTAAASPAPASSHAQAKPSMMRTFNGKPSKPARPRRTNNLSYRGGVGGIGVEAAPKVYLVLWGSQWNSNDPSGESTIVQNFLNHAGGSSWLNSVTQYCQGVSTGTIPCGTSGQHAGNPTGILGGVYTDNANAAPSSPSQSQLAAEAVRAAGHFGNTSSAKNNTVQYVVATATGNNASGFGRRFSTGARAA